MNTSININANTSNYNNIIAFPNTSSSLPPSLAKESIVITNNIPRFARPIKAEFNSDTYVDPTPVKKNHAAEPLRDINDIMKISTHLISQGRYRDNLLFVMGINIGLRIGDLTSLKVGQILNSSDLSFKVKFEIQEQKTKKTSKKVKFRTCYLNDAIMDAATLYLESLYSEHGTINFNDYLFTSNSNNNCQKYFDTLATELLSKGKGSVNSPITPKSVERMLKRVINEELGIDVHASTHLLRKTFAYHVIMSAPESERNDAIRFLQKIFNHASPANTLYYAGISEDEVKSVCQNLNLGGWDFRYAAGLYLNRNAE